MPLIKQLRDMLAMADLMEQRKSMGIKGGDYAFHVAIAGPGALEQAEEYAEALIARGCFNNEPVPLDCNQPMSEDMVEKAFKKARNGIIIVRNVEHLSRRDEFDLQALSAAGVRKCAVVICGSRKGLDEIFLRDEGYERRFPRTIDMDDAAVRQELAELEQKAKAAALEHMITVQAPVQPMRPLKFVPKTEK